MKKAIKEFLLSYLPMAKAIRQAISEKKLPLLAEYITNKTDKDGTNRKN